MIESWESIPSRSKNYNATNVLIPFNFNALLSAVQQFLYFLVCTIWALFRVYKRIQNIGSCFIKFIFIRSGMGLSNPIFITSLLHILLATQTVISMRGLPNGVNNTRRWLWFRKILEVLATISCPSTTVSPSLSRKISVFFVLLLSPSA